MLEQLNELIVKAGADRAVITAKPDATGQLRVSVQFPPNQRQSMALDGTEKGSKMSDEDKAAMDALRAALASPVAFTASPALADDELVEQLGKYTPVFASAAQRYANRTTTTDAVKALHLTTANAAESKAPATTPAAPADADEVPQPDNAQPAASDDSNDDNLFGG